MVEILPGSRLDGPDHYVIEFIDQHGRLVHRQLSTHRLPRLQARLRVRFDPKEPERVMAVRVFPVVRALVAAVLAVACTAIGVMLLGA